MAAAVRVAVIAAVLALLGAGIFVARQSRKIAPRAVIVRRPGATPLSQTVRAAHGGQQNVAPLATVTVSSSELDTQLSAGVADGVIDTREWVSGGENAGAWIKLSWEKPPTITGIELYDRPNPSENVLSGSLTFDDGSVILVPALPPAGTPWSATFPAKTVNWVMFRIEAVQGTNAGLAEIMVYGTPAP